MKHTLAILFFFGAIHGKDIVEEKFTEIYEKRVWGTEKGSGGGSVPENIQDYMAFLSNFIIEKNISSICDLGCGDFGYFETMDLSHVDYTGIEIVKSLVDHHNKNYANDKMRFIHGNIVEIDFPDADLVICKHVLQHLSNKSIFKVLSKLKKYRYCLLMDQAQSDMKVNLDGQDGCSRPLNLLKPPFNLKAKLAGVFNIQGSLHNIILIEN